MNNKVKVESSDEYKIGKSVESIRVVAPSVSGKDRIGKVVYKRKAEYKKPRFTHF